MDGVLNRSVLLALAGERYSERGEGYYRDGRVRDLVEHEGVLVAKVLGTHEYRVKFWPESDELCYSCDCPLGVDGELCKHCVAVGLEFLYGGRAENSGDVMDRLRGYLEGWEKEELVRIILDQATEDELLRERLSMMAAGGGPDGPDLGAFREAIDHAFDPGDFTEPYPEYLRGIENVGRSLSDLLEQGFAVETIELAEYALRTAEGAMDYDVDGYMIGVLHDLEGIHHSACKEAKPDPEALARRLFEWELRGYYDTFFEAANTYADVLGEKGLAVYRRLAEEEWARVPALGPGEKEPESYGDRFRIKHIMEVLARREEDVEALVDVLKRDLSHARAYLRIAEIYWQAGDRDEALEWAEEGMWVFPDGGRSGLRDFLAREYHERSRHEEAVELVWTEFAEVPRLDSYRKLKDHADRAGQWEPWREKALAFVREDIDRKKEKSKRFYLVFPVDHSELVRIFLWEDDIEAAWREAKRGGCSAELWMELADRRAEEHPEDALDIYWGRIEPLVEQTNNAAYQEAYDLLLKVRALMQRLDREQEFEEYVELLRLEYKRKRNFMKLLDRMR